MLKRRISILAVTVILLLVLVMVAIAAAAPPEPQKEAVVRLPPVAIGAHRLAGDHLVPPSKDPLLMILQQQGLPLDATPEQIESARKAWYDRFQKQTDTWVNAQFQEWVDQREAELASPGRTAAAIQPVTATVFYMAVDFGGTDIITIPVEQADGTCVTETHTIVGPLHGTMAAPPATDNFTLWYTPDQVDDPKFYEKLLFGYEGAGRVRMDMVDPYDGQPGINLAGYTMQDYYDHVAGKGNVTITGTVEGWVTVDHSEGWYGANNCETGSHYGGYKVPVAQLVIDALDKFMADHPDAWTDPDFWPSYDGNDDGVVDSFGILHAGADESSGGGAEGPFAIWAHSSDLRNYSQWPDGYKVYEGNPGPEDDIIVGPYTMNPEMLDVGVACEEFGHNFFGLPDLYVSDANNSIGDWDIMSGGSWMGWLGGTNPASMPLWFKMIAAFDTGGTFTPVNWHLPMVERNYDDPTGDVTIYNLENTPDGQDKGVRINLPGYSEVVDNLAGSGKGAYSGTARDQVDLKLERQIPIPATGDNILTFDAYWEIEENWDYGYVEINGASIADMDSVTTDYDPNGNNLGNGITGFGDQQMRFDLSAYAGQTVALTFRYKTDAAATEAGWWIDNVALDGTPIDDFEGASLPGTFPGWTNTDPGWYVVPVTRDFTRYYLVEWRTKAKYDKGIAETAYIHNYSDDVHGDVVSRIPYNMPAALMYYRDTKYLNTYAQRPNYSDPPSYGSKYQLLIVDQNWTPMRIFDGAPSAENYYATWSGRISSYDSGLTLQATEPFSIPHYYGAPTLPPQEYTSKPAVTHFNDTLGYYGGYYYGAPCDPGYVCWVERDGSVVIPARDLYSVRMSDFYLNPLFGLYGYPWGPSWFGSGNPGDDNVQFGVNVELKAMDHTDPENSWATLSFYNYSVDIESTAGTYIVTDPQLSYNLVFQTTVSNRGNEVAKGVELYYDLGDEFVPIEIKIEEGSAVTERAAGFVANLPDIGPGQTVTVTLTAQAAESPGPAEFMISLQAYDGQVERGPWFAEGTTPLYLVYLPIVHK
jgi:immune inhibitor A